MATLLQLHFAFNGPFGDAMAEQLKPLAERPFHPCLKFLKF